MLRICDSIPEVVAALREDTACVIPVDAVDVDALVDGWRAAKDFFAMPEAVKKLAGPLGEMGFSKLAEGKEMYSVNAVNELRNPPFPWPPLGDGLEQKTLSLFWVLHKVTTSITDSITEVSKETKDEFEQERETFLYGLPSEYHSNRDYSESTLFLRWYTLPPPSLPTETEGESNTRCNAHTDSSFLTALPLTVNSSGLQVYKRDTSTWINTPSEVISSTDSSVSHLLLMAGEALAEETKAKYLAAVHRVVRDPKNSNERVTTPFQLRAASKFQTKLSVSSMVM